MLKMLKWGFYNQLQEIKSCNLLYLDVYCKTKNEKQGFIKFIKNDSKDIYNVTKDFYFK